MADNLGLVFAFVILGLFGLAVLAVLIGWMVFVVWFTGRRRQEKRRELEALAFGLGGRMQGDVAVITYREREFGLSHYLTGETGQGPRYLQIETRAPWDFHLRISRGADSILSQFLHPHIRLGDPSWDDKYSLRAKDLEPVRAFLQQPLHGQAIEALFERQISWLTISPGGLAAVKIAYAEEIRNPQLILGHLDPLLQLTA